MFTLFFLACATEAPTDVDPDDALLPLDNPRLLRRLSLDLRGTLPTTAELDAVEGGDEAALAAARDTLLEDPAFEERMVRLLAERWYTRVDEYLIKNAEYKDVGRPEQEYAWERSVGEEPLRLMAHIAANDLPWTDIVTADYTMADELMAQVWPVAYPDDASGWQVSTYTDGRPAAGVLATNGLWWRYYTTVSNYNRGRAAAISRLLLCEDYLARPVSLSGQVALVDSDGIGAALKSNPYCLGCHGSLDPLASSLFGFWVANEYNIHEMDHYHGEREQLGTQLIGHAPAYYGTPISGLGQLGQTIARDPRFTRCAATTFASLLWGREPADDDYARVEALRQDFVAGDGSIKPLLRAVTDTPVYREGALSEAATEAQIADENTTRLVNATQLETVLKDIAGFTWSYNGYEQLDNDTWGYRIQGGGVDGSNVTSPLRTPSLSWLLTTSRSAEGSAAIMAATLDNPEADPRIFQFVSSEDVPGDDAFTQELDALHWRLYAVRADDTWRAQITDLWTTTNDASGPTEAWTVVLTAMMEDPLFLTY